MHKLTHMQVLSLSGQSWWVGSAAQCQCAQCPVLAAVPSAVQPGSSAGTRRWPEARLDTKTGHEHRETCLHHCSKLVPGQLGISIRWGANQGSAHLSIRYSSSLTQRLMMSRSICRKAQKFGLGDHHILDAASLPDYSLMFTYSGGQM